MPYSVIEIRKVRGCMECSYILSGKCQAPSKPGGWGGSPHPDDCPLDNRHDWKRCSCDEPDRHSRAIVCPICGGLL